MRSLGECVVRVGSKRGLQSRNFGVEKMLSDNLKAKIEQLKKLYPQPRSAIMPALHIAQEEEGFVSEQMMLDLAEEFGITPIQVKELVSFYTMYKTKPVGKYHVRVCRTLTCAVLGAKSLQQALIERLYLKEGEVSKDGMWSYEVVECLGSCGTGPVVQINDTLFEQMTPEKLSKLMDKIEIEKPDLKLHEECR